MGIGWIDSIYNNTGSTWYLQSKDSMNNGAVSSGGRQVFTLDDGAYHPLSAHSQYHADWCGIPWYYNGVHYKGVSINRQNSVQFFTSQVDGQNWIFYQDGMTGQIIGKQGAPKIDFHCNFRIEDSGIYLEVVNADAQVVELGTWIYNEAKFWAQVAASVLGATNKSKAGGGTAGAGGS